MDGKFWRHEFLGDEFWRHKFGSEFQEENSRKYFQRKVLEERILSQFFVDCVLASGSGKVLC